jgi:hypothetical protein
MKVQYFGSCVTQKGVYEWMEESERGLKECFSLCVCRGKRGREADRSAHPELLKNGRGS